MSPREAARRATSALTSVFAVVLATLIPKCPLCVAAALSAIGIGTTLGSAVAPIVRPFGFALAVVVMLVAARREWRRPTSSSCAGTCARSRARLEAEKTTGKA